MSLVGARRALVRGGISVSGADRNPAPIPADPAGRALAPLAALWILAAGAAAASARSLWALFRGLDLRVVNPRGMTDAEALAGDVGSFAAVLSGIVLYGILRRLDIDDARRALRAVVAGAAASALVALFQTRGWIASPAASLLANGGPSAGPELRPERSRGARGARDPGGRRREPLELAPGSMVVRRRRARRRACGVGIAQRVSRRPRRLGDRRRGGPVGPGNEASRAFRGVGRRGGRRRLVRAGHRGGSARGRSFPPPRVDLRPGRAPRVPRVGPARSLARRVGGLAPESGRRAGMERLLAGSFPT